MADVRPIVIVGAGMAGLAAARELASTGRRVVVLDKGRSVGGRMSTRRLDRGSADHGAQRFTVTHPRFAAVVERARAVGAVEDWARAFPGLDRSRRSLRGSDGMDALPRLLAEGVDVEVSVHVTATEPIPDGYLVRARDGRVWEASAVTMTPPVPQTLALLDAGDVPLSAEQRRTLEAVAYDPCLAAMVTLDGASGIPAPGALAPPPGPLHWIADNRGKGISPDETVLTVLASAGWSREHYDRDPDEIGAALVEAAGPWLGANVSATTVHRWRYADVRDAVPARFLDITTAAPLLIAGDAFGGSRVENAFLSGQAAAAALRRRIRC